MTYGAKLVVRMKGREVRAGFASEYPLNQGWQHLGDYGVWQGSQMQYKPFKKALAQAEEFADEANRALEYYFSHILPTVNNSLE